MTFSRVLAAVLVFAGGKLLMEAVRKDDDDVKRRVLQAIEVDPDIQNDAAEVYEKLLEKLLEELPSEKKDTLKNQDLEDVLHL